MRERVALVVGVGLEGQPEHGDLAPVEAAEPALGPAEEEQGDRLVDPRDREQHARGGRALLGEGEVLAQAGARREPRARDPAPRVVAVDQVDHLEHVRIVLLAVHHQEVRQGEGRVAQDVGPDLGQLGLDRGRLHDRRGEHLEQAGGGLGRAGPDPADDARQAVDLLEEAPGGDPLRRVGDEDLGADRKAAVLAQVAGHEVGRPGRDRRAEDQRVVGVEHREEVVEGLADVAHVDLDVGERRRAQGDHDVPGLRRVGHPIRQRQGHAIEKLLGPGFAEGHAPGPQRLEARRVVVDADHREPAVGEAQGERQAHPAEADDRDVVAHRPRRLLPEGLGAPPARRPPGRSPGSERVDSRTRHSGRGAPLTTSDSGI